MDKPGLGRAIPALIVGFIASLAFVYALRTWQDMDPVWMSAESSEGAQVGLVLAAFVSMATFMWGVGAFDPKMSEHGEHEDEHEEDAPEKEFALHTSGLVFRAGKRLWDLAWALINDTPKPWRFPYLQVSFFLVNWVVNVIWFLIWLAIFLAWRILLITIAGLPGTLGALLMSVSCLWQTMAFYAGQLFLVLTIAVVTTIVLFTFALLPHGLGLRVATEPNADFFANASAISSSPFRRFWDWFCRRMTSPIRQLPAPANSLCCWVSFWSSSSRWRWRRAGSRCSSTWRIAACERPRRSTRPKGSGRKSCLFARRARSPAALSASSAPSRAPSAIRNSRSAAANTANMA